MSVSIYVKELQWSRGNLQITSVLRTEWQQNSGKFHTDISQSFKTTVTKDYITAFHVLSNFIIEKCEVEFWEEKKNFSLLLLGLQPSQFWGL
jgi:hypothetical protein